MWYRFEITVMNRNAKKVIARHDFDVITGNDVREARKMVLDDCSSETRLTRTTEYVVIRLSDSCMTPP